jgi:hypothetical protein
LAAAHQGEAIGEVEQVGAKLIVKRRGIGRGANLLDHELTKGLLDEVAAPKAVNAGLSKMKRK